MQPQGITTPSSGKIALRYGLIFGLIQTAINSITSLSSTFLISNAGVALGLGVLAFLTGLAAYFVAGILAAKQTGKVSTGTISGLLVGVFYGVLMFIISMVLFFAVNLPKLLDAYNQNGYPSGLTAETAKVASTVGGVAFGIFGLLLAIGVGAGIGALGGLLGKHLAKPDPAAYAVPGQQPYPAQAYPQQPYPAQAYPPQPYPQQQSYGVPSYPGQPYAYTQPNPLQAPKPAVPPPAAPAAPPAPPVPPQDTSNPYDSNQTYYGGPPQQ